MASSLLRNARQRTVYPKIRIPPQISLPPWKARTLHDSAKLSKPSELESYSQTPSDVHNGITLTSLPDLRTPPFSTTAGITTPDVIWPHHNLMPGAALQSDQHAADKGVEDPAGSSRSSIDLESPMSALSLPSTTAAAYWQKIGRWSEISAEKFLSHQWQVANTIEKDSKLYAFLNETVSESIPALRSEQHAFSGAGAALSREAFVADVTAGMKCAPMAVRLTPHTLSVIDWSDPLNDPIRKQFLPTKSTMKPDHPKLEFDSLHETGDSPVPGLVHRYPDKVLFLATSVCPVYCRFCTRSYAIGAPTESNQKQTSFKPGLKRWDLMFDYIENTPAVQDVVVSGGDAYYLQPNHLKLVGERLLGMPNVKRIRFATKGLAVSPSRFLDHEDSWTDVLVTLSNQARLMGKQVALHTHINHPNEMTWVTDKAARRLFAEGVIVRNQSVLLKGVNDDVTTMSQLIRQLADTNIQPYYVYQGDLVKGVEDLRTPLSTILNLEQQIRGTIAGFMMPSFVVDLPAGGGKRLASSFTSYDKVTGVSTWEAPGIKPGQVFEYYDPLP